MLSLLVHMLIILLILGIVYWLVTAILSNIPGIPPIAKQIVLCVFLLVLLVWVINVFVPISGMYGYGGFR